MATNITQLMRQIRALVPLLNPDTLTARIAEWTRGGLPTSSLSSDHRGTNEPALPISDRDDRHFHQLAARYRQALERAYNELEIARRIELIVVPPPTTDRRRYGLWRADMSRKAIEDAGPTAAPCKVCARPVQRNSVDPMRGGRCSTCNAWFVRHGTDRPRTDDNPAA